MGSYTRPKRVFKLVFEDDEYDGLVVRARSLPLGRFLGLMRMADLGTTEASKVDPDQIEELFKGFADALVSWNLTDMDDETGVEHPVSPDLEGMYTQDPDFILEIINSWINAVAKISRPLVPPSTGGGQSPEVPIPMAPLSASQPS